MADLPSIDRSQRLRDLSDTMANESIDSFIYPTRQAFAGSAVLQALQDKSGFAEWHALDDDVTRIKRPMS